MKTSALHSSALVLTSITLIVASSACSIRSDSIVTFYGYPDNDPPGPDTAYNCAGRNFTAGGAGTFSNPLTFASAQGEYNLCEIIYLPYLQKYLRYEDECAQCTTDWSNGVAHIDIWTGSSTVNGGQTQISCEDALTPTDHQAIVRQPSSSLPVNAAALFQNGSCNTDASFENNNPTSYCVVRASPSPPPPGSPASRSAPPGLQPLTTIILQPLLAFLLQPLLSLLLVDDPVFS